MPHSVRSVVDNAQIIIIAGTASRLTRRWWSTTRDKKKVLFFTSARRRRCRASRRISRRYDSTLFCGDSFLRRRSGARPSAGPVPPARSFACLILRAPLRYYPAFPRLRLACTSSFASCWWPSRPQLRRRSAHVSPPSLPSPYPRAAAPASFRDPSMSSSNLGTPSLPVGPSLYSACGAKPRARRVNQRERAAGGDWSNPGLHHPTMTHAHQHSMHMSPHQPITHFPHQTNDRQQTKTHAEDTCSRRMCKSMSERRLAPAGTPCTQA